MKSIRLALCGVLMLAFSFSTALAKQREHSMETFVKVFRGTVGKYQVTAILTNAFGNVWGDYYYTRFKTDSETEPYDHYIPLDGTKSGSAIHLRDNNINTRPDVWDALVHGPESFDGMFIGDSEIVGTWHSKARNKTLPFHLTEVPGVPDDWTSTYPSSKPDPNNLSTFMDRDPLQSQFYELPFVQLQLHKILGTDFNRYIGFLANDQEDLNIVYDLIKVDNGMLTTGVWQAHDLPANSSWIYVDPQTKKLYLIWITVKRNSKFDFSFPPHVYGDRPFPAPIKNDFDSIINKTYWHDFNGAYYDLNTDSIRYQPKTYK